MIATLIIKLTNQLTSGVFRSIIKESRDTFMVDLGSGEILVEFLEGMRKIRISTGSGVCAEGGISENGIDALAFDIFRLRRILEEAADIPEYREIINAFH